MRRGEYARLGEVVYFVREGDAGPIKIGFTKNLDKRLRTIQSHNGAKVIVLATESGGRQRERQLHGKFHWLRLEGEWFKPHQGLLDYIASIGKPKPVYKVPPHRWEVPEALAPTRSLAADERIKAGAAAVVAALLGKKGDS